MICLARQDGEGFTLIEAIVAVAVLAIAITAIIMPFTAGAQNEQSDARRTLAVSLAQEMMEEVLSRPFSDPDGYSEPGPESGEICRALFDNVDDYDGYEEPAGGIASFDGEVIDEPAAAGLSRHVKAEYVHVAGQDTAESPSFIRVTVQVRYRGRTLVTLTRLIYELH